MSVHRDSSEREPSRIGGVRLQAAGRPRVGPVFDRVLNPDSADSAVALFKIPGLNYTIYLNQLVPQSIHNVWTMVAVGILGAFALKGICDYFGNYLINYVGLAAVTDLRLAHQSLLRHRGVLDPALDRTFR